MWNSRLIFWILLSIAAGVAQDDAPREPVPTGGWQLDERTASLRYQPTRHADRFSRAWLDFAAEVKSVRRAELERSYASSSESGQCLACHRSDAEGVRWRSVSQSPTAMDRFSHLPHIGLGQTGDAACAACHKLKPQADIPEGATTSFASLTKQDCASCHSSTVTETTCTTCHSYHRHDPRSARIKDALLGPLRK